MYIPILGVCQLVLVSDMVSATHIMAMVGVTPIMVMVLVGVTPIMVMDLAGAILIMDTVITTITPIIQVEEVLHMAIEWMAVDILKAKPIQLPEEQITLILEETLQIAQLETVHHL
jgi:hypothetical protein